MKYPIEWVLEYAPVDWPWEDLAEKLTMSGSEVEHIRDGVMEVKVTPNRGDTLSMVGLAREVAALSDADVQWPAAAVSETGPAVDSLAAVDIEAPDICPRYVARVVRGVKIGPSPEWMVKRLEAAGLRSISNVVDVTNYVMLELGQPLHAFDYDLLRGHRIVVRRASPGETITTIDGAERALPPDTLVIADAERPVAVAGVMGGSESEISNGTTDVLLESACFDALSIRRTAKALGMSTDASYRFERGVDPNITLIAANRAATLLAEVAGGTVAAGAIDVYPAPVEPWTLALRPSRCNLLLGTQFTAEAMTEALRALDLQPTGTDPIRVTVPTYRNDLHIEDDLAEEVGRLLGYELIPCAAPKGHNLRGGLGAWELFRRKVHTVALECGWQEAVTATLVDGELCKTLGFEATAKLANPLSREVNVLRPSLLPGLVDVVRRNLRQGRAGVAFFEVGRVYGWNAGKPHEDVRWAGAILGPETAASWSGKPVDADFFSVKGVLTSALEHLGVDEPSFAAIEADGFHPGRTASLTLNGHNVGILGELYPTLAEQWDVSGRLLLFELNVAALHHAARDPRFHALPRYPAIARDLAFVVERSMPQAKIAGAISGAAGPLLRELSLFDIYRGERLGEDHQSVAYRLTLRADDRTLSDAEAAKTLDDVRAALTEQVGAAFRT